MISKGSQMLRSWMLDAGVLDFIEQLKLKVSCIENLLADNVILILVISSASFEVLLVVCLN